MLRRFFTLSIFAALLVTIALLAVAGQQAASAGSDSVSISRYAPAKGNPIWGPDILINSDTLSTRARPQVSRILYIAVDPTNPNNVAASYDSYLASGLATAFSTSTDGGRTWRGGQLGPLGDAQMLTQNNAGVGYDASGTAYLVTMAVTSTMSSYFVLTSTNGVLNAPVQIVSSTFEDFRSQPSMAVDPRASGPFASSVYAFWLYTNNVGTYFHGIRLRYSHDKGATWSNDVEVSDPGNEISFGPSSAVASDGTVYVASQQLITYSLETAPRLFLDRSTDGGATWGTDRLIGGGPITPIGVPDWKGHELTMPGSADCSLIRINHYPYIAVAPDDPNTVYAVWNEGRWDRDFTLCTGTGKHSDIAFSRTTDGGLTWSAPIRINDDEMGNGVDQFFPGIGIRSDGLIGVTWYDRRYDPDHPYWYNLAYSQSTDGGVTWSPNVRVSDGTSNPDSLTDWKGIDDLGNRKNLAFGPDFVLPGWTQADPMENVGDFYTDRGTLPPVPPTATATAASTATGTAIATATTCDITFSDVPKDSTFHTFVRCLACRGIISGYSDGTFRPNNNITRGQIAKIVSNAADFDDDPGPQLFEDVPSDNTFYTWINRLANRGHMGGYLCGTVPEEPCVAPNNFSYFRPNANATRSQLSKIVSNAAGLGGTATTLFYADVQLDHPFYLWVMRLTSLGAMSGYPCGGEGEPCDDQDRPYFRPYSNVTRGQSSKIVANTFLPDCQMTLR